MEMTEVQQQAVEKLQKNTSGAKSDSFDDPIIEFLIGRCKEDTSMAKDVVQESKNWKACKDYIYGQAKEVAGNKRMLAVRNDRVFEWAEDYFRNTDDAVNKVLKHAVATSKAQKAGAKPKPKDEKTFDKDKAIKEAVKESPEPKETEEPKPEKKPANKSKKGETDGQMSLFDFI